MTRNTLFSKMQHEEMELNSVIDLGGTIRKITAKKTKAIIDPLRKKFGITRIANIDGLDTLDIPVSIAIRPNARHLCGALGKGLTRELSYVSAVMEAIESYHMETPPLPELTGSYQDLYKNYLLIDPEIFPKGSIARGNIKEISFGWNQATNLVNHQINYIPHVLIKLNSSQLNSNAGLFSVTTNGLAAGNTLNEAILHGLYEVIERDSVSRFLAKKSFERNKTKIQLETIRSPVNKSLLEKFIDKKINIEIWKIPSITDFPAYYCRIYDPMSTSVFGYFYGSGCHMLEDIALSRAITEAAQSRAAFISGSRDDIYPSVFDKQRAQQITFPHSGSQESINGTIAFKNTSSSLYSNSFLKNIEIIVAALKIKGYEHVLVFDHTKPEFNVPVVQVFIPGLQS